MEKGYIHLKCVLDGDEVAGYLAVADAVIADYRATNLEAWELIIVPDGTTGAYYEPRDQRAIRSGPRTQPDSTDIGHVTASVVR